MKNRIIAENWSIQNISSIPDDLKAIYKTVWELSQKVIIDMAADRGAFIDQSQSLNIHLADPNYYCFHLFYPMTKINETLQLQIDALSDAGIKHTSISKQLKLNYETVKRMW